MKSRKRNGGLSLLRLPGGSVSHRLDSTPDHTRTEHDGTDGHASGDTRGGVSADTDNGTSHVRSSGGSRANKSERDRRKNKEFVFHFFVVSYSFRFFAIG